MKRVSAVAALVVALASAHVPAAAASLTLAEREQRQAVLLGQRSITSETFGAEWRVSHESGESVEVMTPFHRLALAARNSAFKNEPLKPQDQEKVLVELKDRLMVWVYLYGSREEFARYFAPRLMVDDREIEPALVQNERTAQKQDNGRYLARCVYWFPTKDITGTSKAVLVVRDSEGQPVSRFAIDLGRMR